MALAAVITVPPTAGAGRAALNAGFTCGFGRGVIVELLDGCRLKKRYG